MEEIRTEIIEETAIEAAESVVEGGGLGLGVKLGIGLGGAALIGFAVYKLGKFVKSKKDAKKEAEEAGEDSVEESVEEAK